MPDTHEHRQLIRLAKRGDRQSITKLVNQYQWLLHQFAGRIRTSLERDDVFQDSILAFIDSLRAFDPDRGVKLITYLYRSIPTKLWGMANSGGVIRTPKVTPENRQDVAAVRCVGSLDPEELADYRDDTAEREQWQHLSAALDRLTERQRFVMWERAHGRRLQEIGDEIGISKERVRQIQIGAVERLREMCGV